MTVLVAHTTGNDRDRHDPATATPELVVAADGRPL